MFCLFSDAPYSMRLSQEKSGKRFYQFKSISKSLLGFSKVL
jgi:hypothetical protein